MSKAQFTPGPWRVSEFEKGTNSKLRLIMGADDWSIAHVGKRTREENAVNAHLIAAAPDLYNACQLALNAFENNWAIDWNVLRSALSKAEGK